MYGLAFLLLAAAHFTKKEIFAKAIAPVFFFISKLNIAFRSFSLFLLQLSFARNFVWN